MLSRAALDLRAVPSPTSDSVVAFPVINRRKSEKREGRHYGADQHDPDQGVQPELKAVAAHGGIVAGTPVPWIINLGGRFVRRATRLGQVARLARIASEAGSALGSTYFLIFPETFAMASAVLFRLAA